MMKTILYALAFAVAMAAPAVYSNENLPEIKEHHQGGIPYICGGLDPLERKAIKRRAERYQVQLSFAREGSKEPLAGVKVTMIDYKGDKALELNCDGPIFFANPPAGRWTIDAEYNGQKVSKTIDVNGRFYVTFDFRFKDQQSN